MRRAGVVEVDDRAIRIVRDREGRQQGDAARAAGMAAGDALVVGLPAFERRVVAPVVAAGLLRAEQMVIDGSFELVGKLRFRR